MTRTQSLLHDSATPVEPGFADLPAFLAVTSPHEVIASDPQARLEAADPAHGTRAGERLPPGRATRPGEH